MLIKIWTLKFTNLLVAVLLLLNTVASRDDKCYVRPDVVVPDADVQFGLLLSLRSKVTSSTGPGEAQAKCGPISASALEQFLAIQWLVNRVNGHNNGTGYIPGVKIGFQALDDFGSPLHASRNALNFLDPWSSRLDHCPLNQATSSSANDQQEPVPIGLVGASDSDIAMEVASLVRTVPLPVVSMAATAPELSNKTNYPNFLRTVPSDELQMDAIASMLQQLKWTYIAVIHMDDQHGHAASASLTRQATARGICIQRTLMLTTDYFASDEFSTDLTLLVQKSLHESLAVVFIGTASDADDLLWAIEKGGHESGRRAKSGIRLVLAKSPTSSKLDTSIFEDFSFGEGTLAVGRPDVDMSADLETDMRTLVANVKSGRENHSLIEEFFQGTPDGELFQRSTRNTLLPPTLHAVLALVEALRTVHTKVCQGANGMCQAMLNDIESGNVLTATQHTTLDYSTLSPGIAPQAFSDQKLAVTFDERGDVTLPKTVPAYTLHQYRKEQKQYAQVGYFLKNQMVLEEEKMQWATSSGRITNIVPTSVCRERCDEHCLPAQGKGEMPVALLPGKDGYILGVFSIHDADKEKPFSCSSFRKVSNDPVVVEGFLYAVQRLRELTGLQFGALAIDDCYSPLRTLSILQDLLSGLPSANLGAFRDLGNFGLEQVVGVIACRSSGCTIPVARFFMQLQIPVVSYAASSLDLDDKANYQYFLRTVPSDVYQTEVMMKVIKFMGWEYVGLLYVNNNYGIKAAQAFRTQANESRKAASSGDGETGEAEGGQSWQGVCIADEIVIEERESHHDAGNFFRIWKRLSELGVKVVVFFAIDSRYRAFLSYLERNDKHDNFIFLASEEWATNPDILRLSPLTSRGSLTLKVEEVDLEDVQSFRQNLTRKRPSPNDTNIWFSEFWQHVFQCNIPGGFINIYERTCDPSWNLNASEVTRRTDEQRLRHAMNAVYAMGKGLQLAARQLCEGEFPCPYLRLKVDELTKLIQAQSRVAGSLTFPMFDDDGNGALGFDVYNIQKNGNNDYEYVKVGTFNRRSASDFNKERLKFYTDTESMSVRCTPALCSHCPAPVSPPPEPSSSESDDPDEYQGPDIVIISLVGVLILVVLVAVAALILCYCKNKNAIKKYFHYREEQIYDEPERHVYQQYAETHGFRFANLNIEPLIGGANANNGLSQRGFQQSAIGHTAGRSDIHGDDVGGYDNDAFLHDRVDSVSQIFSNGGPNAHRPHGQGNGSQPQPAMGTDMVRNRSKSFQAETGMSSSPGQRPLPVSPMGGAETMSNIMHDTMAYHDALSDVFPHGRKMASAANTPTHASNMTRISTTPSRGGLNNNATHSGAISPTSCSNNSVVSNTSGATASPPFYQPEQQQQQGSDPGIVYYMQDNNGHLAAHFAPLHTAAMPTPDPHERQAIRVSATSDDLDPRTHPQPIMHQLSQESEQSSVHADYGPYSQQAAMQRAIQQLQKQPNIPRHLQQLQYIPEQDLPQQEYLLQQYYLQQQQQQQQQQQYHPEQVPTVPASQPPRHATHRGNDIELRDMPGGSFFAQPSHHPQPQQQQHHEQPQQSAQNQDHQHLQQQHHYQPPAKRNIHNISGPPPPPQIPQLHLDQQQAHHYPQKQQQQQPHQDPQAFTAQQQSPPVSQTQTAASTSPTTPASSSPVSATSDSDGRVDTALGSSLSPGAGLDPAVDLDFQPELSHDPRPPNDLYLESIDLASTLPSDPTIPDVNTISPSSRRRTNNNNRAELVALTVLNGNVSKV